MAMVPRPGSPRPGSTPGDIVPFGNPDTSKPPVVPYAFSSPIPPAIFGKCITDYICLYLNKWITNPIYYDLFIPCYKWVSKAISKICEITIKVIIIAFSVLISASVLLPKMGTATIIGVMISFIFLSLYEIIKSLEEMKKYDNLFDNDHTKYIETLISRINSIKSQEEENHFLNEELIPEEFKDDENLNKYICPLSTKPIRYPIKDSKGIIYEARHFMCLIIKHNQLPFDQCDKDKKLPVINFNLDSTTMNAIQNRLQALVFIKNTGIREKLSRLTLYKIFVGK